MLIGNQIRQYSDRVILDDLTASATADYTLQLNGVNFVPSSASALTVSLNGLIQKPESSYTVNNATLSFSSALTASDSIDFIIAERGITLQTPSAGSVNTAQLATDAVTAAKLNDDIISGQTALTSEPADTDEFLVSDAGTIKRIDYSLIKGGGITNSQIWLLTSGLSTTGNSSFADITANLSESTLTGYGRLGSAMSVSSGVFTFPSTGYWSVDAVYNFTGAEGYGRGEIKVTTNNSTYSTVAQSQEETDNQEYASLNMKAQIDVTDTSNVKVKFTQGGTTGTLSGSSSYWRTGFMFTRLGDT